MADREKVQIGTMLCESADLRSIEVGLERDHNRIPHYAGRANRLNLAAWQNLGRVARVPGLYPEWRKHIRIPQRLGGCGV
jgi:hypothetical protein